MAIAFDSDATTTDTDGGTVVANQPSGVAAGKVVLAFVILYDNIVGSSIAEPAGWSQYREDTFQPVNSWRVGIYWKVLAGGDSFTFTCSGNYTDIYIACYTGAHATTPLVDTGSVNSGSGTTATGTGVTVTTAGSYLFAAHVGYATGLSVGFGGMAAREVNFDGVNNFYDESVGSGATGNRTATVASSDEWSVTMGVIMPAAGGGGSPANSRKTLLGVGRRELIREERGGRVFTLPLPGWTQTASGLYTRRVA